MADAGYSGEPPATRRFDTTKQALFLETALRTTRKSWGSLSDSYANVIIELKLSVNIEEAEKAIQRFMDSLK
jgi:hypothetical protein